MAESERTPSGVTEVAPETARELAADDLADRDVSARTARMNPDKSLSDTPEPGVDDLDSDSELEHLAGVSSPRPATEPAVGFQDPPKLDGKNLDTAELDGHPADDAEVPPGPPFVPGPADVDVSTREVGIAQIRDDVDHADGVMHAQSGGPAATSTDPAKPLAPQEAGGPASPESGERPAARTSGSDDAGAPAGDSGSTASGGAAQSKVDLVDPNDVLNGTDGAPDALPKPSDPDGADASDPVDVAAGDVAGGGTDPSDVDDRKPVVAKKPVARSTDQASTAERPAPPPAQPGSRSPETTGPSNQGGPRQQPPVASTPAPAGAGRRRLFTDQAPPRIGRSIPRMARSTLAQVAGMPLDFDLDTDEQDEPFLPGELPSLSLQHVLGLARVDEPVDTDLEADLKAELGVHGINIDEFQERLNAMLSSRHREHVMYEVQSSFRSVLESVEQLSRLTTGQVRYRNERLSADAQQVVRVLLAVRVAAERVDEAVRLSEQAIRQTHDYAVSLSRLIRDSEVRVKMIHTTAANIESIWHQLRAQQVAAAPERSVVLWCGAAAAVGAGVVVALLSLLGY